MSQVFGEQFFFKKKTVTLEDFERSKKMYFIFIRKNIIKTYLYGMQMY